MFSHAVQVRCKEQRNPSYHNHFSWRFFFFIEDALDQPIQNKKCLMFFDSYFCLLFRAMSFLHDLVRWCWSLKSWLIPRRFQRFFNHMVCQSFHKNPHKYAAVNQISHLIYRTAFRAVVSYLHVRCRTKKDYGPRHTQILILLGILVWKKITDKKLMFFSKKVC